MNRQLGFNIIELMVAIAVLGILLGIGVPAMQSFIQNNRLTSQINQLSTTFALARSEAVKRNQQVVVCSSTSGTACTTGSTWDDGWMVYVDRDADEAYDAPAPGADGCVETATVDCLLSVQAPFSDTNTLTPGSHVTNLLVYVPDGSVRCNIDADPDLEACANANTFFTLCDFRGAAYAKGISISRTGRTASVSKQPNGSAFTCP